MENNFGFRVDKPPRDNALRLLNPNTFGMIEKDRLKWYLTVLENSDFFKYWHLSDFIQSNGKKERFNDLLLTWLRSLSDMKIMLDRLKNKENELRKTICKNISSDLDNQVDINIIISKFNRKIYEK